MDSPRRCADDHRADNDAQSRLIGKSPAMRQLRRGISKFARSDLPVLLQGETGVGKELVARTIHQESRRSSGPFVAVNCTAIPHDLLESQLFGHLPGSFTGANTNHRGYFAQARGGTILLDEISEMPPDLQPKLLRALEIMRFRPLGGTRDQPFDAGILTATNRDLAKLIDNGFRGDLYYRIHVLRIEIPPLRDREECKIPERSRHRAPTLPALLPPRSRGSRYRGRMRRTSGAFPRTQSDPVRAGRLPG